MRRLTRRCALAAVALVVSFAVASPASAHLWSRATGGVKKQGVYDQGPRAMAAAAPRAEPPITATPRANCLPGGIPEGPMQGRVPPSADRGFLCNLTVIGKSGSTGGFRVHRYVDRSGHECAYYDTTLLYPTNTLSLSAEPTGVAVLDMTDPRRPQRTDSLLTPAMQSPHESVNISVERGILAAVTGNPLSHPGHVDVYDISQDCRHPVLQASVPAAAFGHESGMAPDGRTFYPTSISTDTTTAVDISNPKLPLRIWEGQYNTHGMSVSDDGRRGYLAAGDGLIIIDLSEVQARKPNPQVREISRLVWSNMTVPQVALPVTINGKAYIVEVDEFSSPAGSTDVTSHGPRVGAARIIDISDERRPFVVSNIRLGVHQPENRAAIADDPGARSPVQGYAAHYCNVPQRREPGIVACTMIVSGLRVFDIRDPAHPKEIAYHVAPPSTVSAGGSPFLDERANFAMSQPTFAPERGEIWYSDGTSGFYAVRMDPRVWPFPVSPAGARTGCFYNTGFGGVGARTLGRRVSLFFNRLTSLPVRIEIFRVASGAKLTSPTLVARYDGLTRSLTWNGVANRGRRGPVTGQFIVRFTMLRRGRAYDVRWVGVARSSRGRFTTRPGQERRPSCGLLANFKLERAVFGGPTRTALRGSYRLNSRANLTIDVTRRGKIVRRFSYPNQTAGRTHLFSLRPTGLPVGEYRMRLTAYAGEDQIAYVLAARRL